MRSYKVCLSDYETVLPAIAKLINAKYDDGAFSRAKERFHDERQADYEWQLSGMRGRLAVKFEEYEGYFFSTFEATDEVYDEGKALLWQAYLQQGGNTKAVQSP